MSHAKTDSQRIVALTRTHWIEGNLFLRDRRLSDVLNDPLESVFPLEDSKIARLTAPEKVLGNHPTGFLLKSGILVAFEPQTAKRSLNRFYNYVQKAKHSLFLGFEGLEVRGHYNAHGSVDLRQLLTNPAHPFLPITEASVVVLDNPLYTIEPDTIVINAHRLLYATELPKRED